MPLRNLTWLFVAAVVSLLCFGEANRNRYAGILSESIDKISRYYVKPVERRQLFESGLEGMLSKLDPNSSYIAPDEYSGFREDIEQRFGGVGIEVGHENDLIKVLHPIVGTPAYHAGLLAGDIIVSIDGQSLRGLSLNDAVKIMRGPDGSTVKLEVLRESENETRTFAIKRAQIPIESVRGDLRDRRGHWSFRLQQDPTIGYMRIRSFGDRTADELEQAIETVQNQVRGLIIDLRQNPGGLLTAAVDMCDLFLKPDQVVVTTRGRDPEFDRSFSSNDAPIVDPNLPLVVLVDRYSASASEIFAACMQDYDRATIVGERSYGKGTVQNVIEIEGGKSAFRLTTQTYWRPSGKNIHHDQNASDDDDWGVQPQPENLVEYRDDNEIEAVFLQRQKRDYLVLGETDETTSTATPTLDDKEPPESQSGARPESELPSQSEGKGEGDSQSEEADTEPVVDRQLQRAIDVLNEQTTQLSQPARAA